MQPVDVIIVGLGPTGVTLAGLLGRAGYTVAVFEKLPDLYPLPRAIGHLADAIHGLAPAAGFKTVLLPGERGYQATWQAREQGVSLPLSTIRQLRGLANQLGVAVPGERA